MVPVLNFAGFVYSQPACHQVLIEVNLQKDETVLKTPASVLEFRVMYYASMLEGKKFSRMLGGTLGYTVKSH